MQESAYRRLFEQPLWLLIVGRLQDLLPGSNDLLGLAIMHHGRTQEGNTAVSTCRIILLPLRRGTAGVGLLPQGQQGLGDGRGGRGVGRVAVGVAGQEQEAAVLLE